MHIDGVCEVVFYKLKMVITILKVKKKTRMLHEAESIRSLFREEWITNILGKFI